MHSYEWIPLSAVLISAAFGAVSIAWDSERRSTRSMGAIFLCTGAWALIDLFTYLESDPARALVWMRWAHLPPLLIGPAAIWVVGQIRPPERERLSRQARVGAVVCAALGIFAAFAPGNVQAMIATDYGGWMPDYGPLSIALIPIGMLLPIYAAVLATRIQREVANAHAEKRRARAARICVALSLVAIGPSEYLLPLLGIPFPRLGALAVACASALLWLRVLHEVNDLALSPRGVARALLADFHDGVALVRPDGCITRTNARFAQMSGRTARALIGASIGDLIDAPVERICAGVEDRESILRGAADASIPVSLSSSIVRDRSGGAIGVVVVCRDLRDIDALRAQLMTSGRLAAIGELAAGIAHEVNNPVAFIRSDLNLLGERIGELRSRAATSRRSDADLTLFDRAGRRVANTLTGIDRVAEIVRDVREFAHMGGTGQGGSDPEAVVESAMRLARLTRGEEVVMQMSSHTDAERIESGQELKQVLLALMRLLVEATEKGGRVDVDLRSADPDLLITLSVGTLAQSSARLLSRFDLLGQGVLEGSHDELGLAVAIDLIDRLEGGLSVEATGAHAIRVEVSVPLAARGTLR